MVTESLTAQGLKLAREEGYQVSAANTIIDPGKFEGEHVSTLVFWDNFLNGIFDDETDDGILIWELTEQERMELGNPSPEYRLYCDDQGFVHGNI